MSALALSGIIFALTLGGIFLGALLRRSLPKHHLSEDAQSYLILELSRPFSGLMMISSAPLRNALGPLL
jgi:uncharacterized membrane protein